MARSGKNHKGGRPPGKLAQKTLDAMKVRDAIKQRTLKVSGLLFESQLSLARGAEYLFRIDKEFIKTGSGVDKDGNKKGYWRNKKPVLVESPEEMRQYLEDEFCNGDAEDEFDESAAYYFLSARDPQNAAIEAMQDRSLGRVASTVDVILTPKPIYGGQSQLPAGKNTLSPKKIKSIVVHDRGRKTVEQVEEE